LIFAFVSPTIFACKHRPHPRHPHALKFCPAGPSKFAVHLAPSSSHSMKTRRKIHLNSSSISENVVPILRQMRKQSAGCAHSCFAFLLPFSRRKGSNGSFKIWLESEEAATWISDRSKSGAYLMQWRLPCANMPK